MADLPAGATPKISSEQASRKNIASRYTGGPIPIFSFRLENIRAKAKQPAPNAAGQDARTHPGASYANAGGGTPALSGESQAGTGRFLDARNDELKSFDW